MVASVPEQVKRTISMQGTSSASTVATALWAGVSDAQTMPQRKASSTAARMPGWLCPRIAAPWDVSRSTYSRPSRS